MTESNISIVQKYFQAYTERDRTAIEAIVDEAFRLHASNGHANLGGRRKRLMPPDRLTPRWR